MASSSSKAPIKPIKQEPNQVYLHVSYSSPDPPTLPQNGLEAKYLGPIGELSGEGIYQIQSGGQPVKRDDQSWQNTQKDLLESVKRSEGVKSVKVLDEPRQRVKRDEF
ncbi:hypothetical protein I302_108258 [Kwoniella bestiolae CBS 10118]|uniref:Uncharacterized protein n=1 Tax=Kwoniella bestiolae CBS 10118 TaxID=1296100 RepID=A0A1B9FW79_9TREE|nr:hypothetical protein I302_07376 [Kwoniella bestiolae CBS 10118]OCF23026.1 hypothetical protein I302_07376 [Kwoniella bestiolae CBS 10118]